VTGVQTCALPILYISEFINIFLQNIYMKSSYINPNLFIYLMSISSWYINYLNS
jgi:hypothetical protein